MNRERIEKTTDIRLHVSPQLCSVGEFPQMYYLLSIYENLVVSIREIYDLF